MISDIRRFDRFAVRDMAVLAGIIFLFFCCMLGSRPLSVPDEGRYVEIPREMVEHGNYLTPRLNGVKYFEKPVLFYWLEALAIKLGGINEFTLRLWPAGLAAFGCFCVGIAGARLFGRLGGLTAAVVLATSVLYYGLSRAIILDMPVTVFLTAALLSFLVGVQEGPGPRRRAWLWSFYAFSALAVLTKGLIGILIPCMVIGAWIVLLNDWRMLRTLYLPSGLALFLLIAAPWHILVMRANPEFFHFYFIQEHFQRYLTKMHGRYHPMWFFIPIVLAGLFPWSVFLIQAIRHNLPTWRGRHEQRNVLFLFLWAGLVFLFFSASSSKLVPYILPVFPPLALLIGRYLPDAEKRNGSPAFRPAFTAFLMISLLLAAALFGLPYFWPSAAEVQLLGMYRYAFVCTLTAGGITTWILSRGTDTRRAFGALLATTLLFLILVNAAAARMDTKSVKDLALALKPRLKPGIEVAAYNTYYQDLPVYLEHRITVADWKGELEFGTTIEDTSGWMIDDAAFWKQWQGPETMYVLTELRTYEIMRREPGRILFPIARNSRNVLLVNKEADNKPL